MNYFLSLLLFCFIGHLNSAEYGICIKNHISVHKSISHESEQITQLIFGDIYKVLSKSSDKQWLYIENQYDKYKGWISLSKHRKLSQQTFNNMINDTFPVCGDLKGFIEFEGNKFEISLGSTLPFYDNGVIEIDNKKGVFTGNAVFVPREFNAENVISTSKLCLDIPYLWGGKNALGYDCSGFVQVVYKTLGIKLPRDSRQQVLVGEEIELKDAKVGDLAFFHIDGRVIHVGIVIDDNKIIHSSKRVKINTLDKTGIWIDETQSYSHYLKCIKRIVR